MKGTRWSERKLSFFLPGHCEKTMAIINLFYHDDELSNTNWLVIADDDTLLRSVFVVIVLSYCFLASVYHDCWIY